MILYVKAGDVIFKQGDTQASMYTIQKGKVSIVIDHEKPSERQLTELQEGQFFGEMSLLEGEPRSATAIAVTDSELEVIDADGFNGFIESNPEFAMTVLKYFSSRLRAITADYQEACRTISDVYDIAGVKEAIEKADETAIENVEEAKETAETKSKTKKGFLARSMKRFKEIYESGADSQFLYYNF